MPHTDDPRLPEGSEHRHHRHDDPEQHRLENPVVSHEDSDANAVSVGKWGIGLALGIVASVFVVWFVFDRLASWAASESPAPLPVVNMQRRPLPPEPRLQAQPRLDMGRLRDAEDQLLTEPQWTDRERVAARIPVGDAMNLMLQKGFPVRSQPADAATAQQRTLPSDSSSGQTYERRAK